MNYDELNLTKDEIGIVPIDMEDLISKALEKQLHECDPSTEENRMLLATFLRKEENDQVYFNLLSELLETTTDFDLKDFLSSIENDLSGSNPDFYNAIMDYFYKKYESTFIKLDIMCNQYKEAYDAEKDRLENSILPNENNEDIDYEAENQVINRIMEIEGELLQMEYFKEDRFAFSTEFDNMAFENAFSAVGQFIRDNSKKLTPYNKSDFDKLLSVISKTPTWNNTSDNLRKYFLDKLYVEASKVVDMSSEKVIVEDTNTDGFNLNSNLDFSENNVLKR